MIQEQGCIKITGELSDIFPDIDGELCTKQSTLFGKLKQAFNKLYDGYDPTHYIVAQGIVKIMDNKQVSLAMALENGITLMVSKTFSQSNIFINGNHIDEELIYSHSGDLEEGLHEQSQDISVLLKTAISEIPTNELMGAIIYIHSNIPEDLFQYRQSMMIALYTAILLVNSRLQTMTIPKIIEELVASRVVGEEADLENYFYDYHKRKFALSAGVNNFQVPLQSSYKMIFCQLGLAQFDKHHHKSSRKLLEEKKSEINRFLKNKYDVESIYQAYEGQVPIQEAELPGNIQESKALLEVEINELNLMCQYSNQRIDIHSLIKRKWAIDSEIKQLYTPEVIELVEMIERRVGVNTYAIVEGQFVLLIVEKQKYAEMICTLRQALHKGELKSKSFFKIEEDLVQNRWGDDSEIGQKIFASAPCESIAIFNPSESIWFE